MPARCADDVAAAVGWSRALAIESVRVSCQTIALCRGRPVRLSQTMVVSRWLVMPRADRSAACRLRLRQGEPMTVWVRSQISSGLCSTQPARGRTCSCSSWCRPTSAPVVVEHHEPGARRPLVDRPDEVGHAETLVALVGEHPAYRGAGARDLPWLAVGCIAASCVANRRIRRPPGCIPARSGASRHAGRRAYSLGAGSWSSGRPGCSPPRASR